MTIPNTGKKMTDERFAWFKDSLNGLASDSLREELLNHITYLNGEVESEKKAYEDAIELLTAANAWIEELVERLLECRNRLAAHDGCSRYQIGDSSIIHRADKALSNSTTQTQPEKPDFRDGPQAGPLIVDNPT